MRIFVYEHTCAGVDTHAAALRLEGEAMLRAVLEDLARLPGVQPVTLPPTSNRTRPTDGIPWAGTCDAVLDAAAQERCFRRLAREADWSLIIAPEFDDVLARRCAWVAEAGGRWLGCTAEAIRLTADKLLLAAHLSAQGVATPATTPADQCRIAGPLVCKPRFGAGALASFVVRSQEELGRATRLARAEMNGTDLVAQAYVSGIAASVGFLIGPNALVPLLAGRQRVSVSDRIDYQGGELPLPAPLQERAVRLGRRAVAAVPGLLGYVGVDLVLGAAAADDCVIEINPRLTTSYIGLRRLARCNLAAEMLRIAAGGEALGLQWGSGRVVFDKHGVVHAS